MKRNLREIYCLYFPDEGRYTRLMTLAEAKKLVHEFCTAYIKRSKIPLVNPLVNSMLKSCDICRSSLTFLSTF